MGSTAENDAGGSDVGSRSSSGFEYDSGRRARRAQRFADGERFAPEPADESRDDVNVNRVERVASVLGGGALALYGAKRKDVTGVLLAVLGGALVQRGVSGHCGVYGALGVSSEGGDEQARLEDGRPTQQHGRNAVLDASKAERIEHAVTIAREPAELFRFWRDLTNLPRIMGHLESVTVIDAKRSHWKAKAPAGLTVEWDAVVHNEIPDELIAWKSAENASVPNAGSVHFKRVPGGLGTELRVVLEYEPPAGKLGVAIAKLFGEEPQQQVREDLRRFKQTMETGEVVK
jgi:uncharacterized membrane protein